MEKKRFISWRRVSTQKQGVSGLGLEAQANIISHFVRVEDGELIADYAEVYTGTNLKCCTELRKAMEHAKSIGATLIIARTNRFRDTEEALSIYRQMNGNIYFCDCTTQEKFILTLMFSLAERDALITSIQTKTALAAKKKRDGSWAHLYGKNTGTTRDDALEKARAARAVNKRNEAINNANNEKFWGQVQIFERAHSMCVLDDIDAFTQDLITAKVKTSSGLDMTPKRARAMYYNVRKLYATR